MNQLVNEAVKDYVRRRSREVERDLESTLASLRAYRKHDPDFEMAIAAVASAEARYGKEDPAEGDVVVGKLVNGPLVEEQSSGPIQSEIRKLLDG
jgi:hypothetical protein